MAILTQARLKQIIKEELRKVLKEGQVSTGEVDSIINDPEANRKLLQYFIDNPEEADKIIDAAKQAINNETSLNESFFEKAKSYYSAGASEVSAQVLAAASIPVAGALNYALYYKPYGSEGQAKWLVGAAGLALLAHLADIAMHSKKK